MTLPPPDTSCQEGECACPCIVRDRKIVAKELREIAESVKTIKVNGIECHSPETAELLFDIYDLIERLDGEKVTK